MIDLTPYIPVILSALVGVLIVAVVLAWRALGPWLQYKAAVAASTEHYTLCYWASVAVQAANQMLSESTGDQKLEYVLSVMDKMYPDLDEEVIRAVVESSVLQEKVQTKEAV